MALTTYYNPLRGTRRRRNYDVFRANLGVPLVAVEWAQDGRFELSPRDADVLIQVQGGDLMWQKERLLNCGLARIRSEGLARDVAIVDADVVFEAPDWHKRVSAALDKCPIVQCQSLIDHLPPLPPDIRTRDALAAVAPERSIESLACVLAQGKPLFTLDAETVRLQAVANFPPSSGSTGMAIAVRLADLPSFELYDGNIVGGGDLLMATAFIGRLKELFDVRNYASGHEADAFAWAARCLPRQPRLGWADNRVMHLWHGSLADRQYGERLHILGPRGYDPAIHLDRSGQAMRFTPCASELKNAVAHYLASRNDA
ncbi:hypothetical protein [Caenimonas koreensis]|uniref:Glycosyl transferase family 2 n=1 Tax=Caenimonas koreensis DSM 17982 TaxID=1121255 RepID=A0A844B6L2_9BURK|nr:hypothetical protein [Caenimonas koreensis]MRD48823.1 hypothetical protein [Caenimonas koreensis DSM 17982]